MRFKPTVPSQQKSRRIPYMPGVQPDIRQMGYARDPMPIGSPDQPGVYVISTYDARPINGVDFSTYSGTDPADTGFEGSAGAPYFTSSIFYTVPQGRIAVVRDFQILVKPVTGEPGGEGGGAVFTPTGASNFRMVFSFLVDDVLQEGVSNRVTWNGAFGDVFGECYILAMGGQTIELRVDGNDAGGSSWEQMLMMFHGNLIDDKGRDLQFQPGADSILPVANKEQL